MLENNCSENEFHEKNMILFGKTCIVMWVSHAKSNIVILSHTFSFPLLFSYMYVCTNIADRFFNEFYMDESYFKICYLPLPDTLVVVF